MTKQLLIKFVTKFIPLIFIFTFLIPLCANADYTRLSQRPDVKVFIRNVSTKYGLSRSYLASMIDKAHILRHSLGSKSGPTEVEPWYIYKPIFIDQDRINAGLKYWDRSNKLFNWEIKEYKIPPNVILAIIGIESHYGQKMGDYRVLDSLTTLAFYYPPEKKFFQEQLKDFFLLARMLKINPTKIKGSYAGAMGQPQFMPSSYLNYGVDFHSKGYPNLFNDKADVIFSVGNFLRQHGWEPDQPIAARAHVRGRAYQAILKRDLNRAEEPYMSLRTLKKYGVTPVGYYRSNLKAYLFELQGENGPEYWLGFHNLYVITKYNSSDQYAMVIYELGKTLHALYNKKHQQEAKNKHHTKI